MSETKKKNYWLFKSSKINFGTCGQMLKIQCCLLFSLICSLYTKVTLCWLSVQGRWGLVDMDWLRAFPGAHPALWGEWGTAELLSIGLHSQDPQLGSVRCQRARFWPSWHPLPTTQQNQRHLRMLIGERDEMDTFVKVCYRRNKERKVECFYFHPHCSLSLFTCAPVLIWNSAMSFPFYFSSICSYEFNWPDLQGQLKDLFFSLFVF